MPRAYATSQRYGTPRRRIRKTGAERSLLAIKIIHFVDPKNFVVKGQAPFVRIRIMIHVRDGVIRHHVVEQIGFARVDDLMWLARWMHHAIARLQSARDFSRADFFPTPPHNKKPPFLG